jgi:hypothetical protein
VVRKLNILNVCMKLINRNWAIKNAMPFSIIGFFLFITNDIVILKYLGIISTLFSLYLWYIAFKGEKK